MGGPTSCKPMVASLTPAALRAVIPALGLALLLTLGIQPCHAGEASAMFRVTAELLGGPTGVGCRTPVANLFLCGPRPVVAGAVNGDTRVILYGSSLIEEDGHMWGAVAASRRVKWSGRDYVELTLSW